MGNKFRIDYDGNDEIKKEVESIKNAYLEKSKMQKELEELRKIDFKVNNIPLVVSLSFGIIGVLLFGLSMSIFLEFKKGYVWGIISAILGVIMIILAYPIYNLILKRLKNKYKDKIFELSDKILKEDN